MTKVRRVIDGHTFETAMGQEIRLLDVSMPEHGELADKAKKELRNLLRRRNVIIYPVGLMYGRFVANVVYKGQSINDAMNAFINKAR